VDTGQLVARWPDILDAVRDQKKVAWMLLSSAEVQSLADGALTIGFSGEGQARGFISSGHDAVLSGVLRQMFGITPQIRAIARTPDSAGSPAGRGGSGGASPPPGRGAPPPPAAAGPASSNEAPPWDGPASEWDDDPRDHEDEYADAGGPAIPPPAVAAPGARPGGPAGVLTGMDLIQRELGGRVIEDPGLA
jgi:DNA polymerase-3 subunit gamma/tau